MRPKKPSFLGSARPVSVAARWVTCGVFTAAALTCGVASESGCSGTTSSTATTVITGISVRAETLTAERGCGPAPSQVFKYTAVVLGPNAEAGGEVPLAVATYDCFTDATFVNLPAADGRFDYRLEVFLYDRPAFEAQAATLTRPELTSNTPTVLRGTAPTWTTHCTATQYANVQSLAACVPVQAGLAGLDPEGGTVPPTPDAGAAVIRLDTAQFASASGAAYTCAALADAGADAQADAGEDEDAGDAEVDAGDAEAGAADADTPSRTYDLVRVRARLGNTIVAAAQDIACPSPFVLPGATPEGAVLTLDVGLSRNGEPLFAGEPTTCTAVVTAGQTTTPVCAAFP